MQLIAIAGLIIAVLIAIGLRFFRLDLIDFRFDQAYPLQYALDITQGRLWAVQPHGSAAVHPPLYLYLMALPYLFTRDFMTVVGFRVFLDVISVALCWLIGYRYFNWRVATIAAVLYAFAPWAIQFARNTWPVPQPLFSAITLIGLCEVIIRRNRWGWTLAGLGLSLCAGTHLAGIYIIPTVVIALWIGRKSFHLRHAVLGIVPLLVVALVYVIYDAGKNFANISSIISSFGKPSTFSYDALTFATWMSGGTHLSDLTGQAYKYWLQDIAPVLTSIDTLQVALLAFGMLVTVMLCLRTCVQRFRKVEPPPNDTNRDYTMAAFVLLSWWWLPVLLQLRHSQPVMLQYMPAILPAPFLLTAIGIDTLITWLKNWTQKTRAIALLPQFTGLVAAGLIALIVGWQLWATLRLNSIVERYDTSQGYGLPVKSALAAVQSARDAYATGQTGDVVVVVKDYVTPWHEQGLILKVLLADVPHRFINSDVDGWILGLKDSAYILAPGTNEALEKLKGYVVPGSVKTKLVPIRSELAAGYLYAELPQWQTLSDFTPSPSAVWDSGIELLAYRATQRDSDLDIDLILKVLKTPLDNTDYHWFNHIFEGTDKIAGQDGSGVHPNAWRTDDIVIHHFSVPLGTPLPSLPLTLRIGSYTYPLAKTVMVSIGDNPPQNGVDLALSDMR